MAVNASICLVTFITTNLLQPKGPTAWGPSAVAINKAYADVHGYSYHLYQQALQPDDAPVNWSPPIAAEKLLQTHPECEYVLALDGDAVVNNLRVRIEDVVAEHMPDHIDLLFTCHKHQHTADGDCLQCKCTRENGGGCDYLQEYEEDSDCGVNMGVFLVRNRNQGPQLLNWWTTAGHGACNWTAGNRVERKWNLQAQVCSNKLKNAFPQRIRVTSAEVMNMPSFFDPKTDRAKFKQNADYHYNSRCFTSKAFICHTLGVRGGGGRDRKRMFDLHYQHIVKPWHQRYESEKQQ